MDLAPSTEAPATKTLPFVMAPVGAGESVRESVGDEAGVVASIVDKVPPWCSVQSAGNQTLAEGLVEDEGLLKDDRWVEEPMRVAPLIGSENKVVLAPPVIDDDDDEDRELFGAMTRTGDIVVQLSASRPEELSLLTLPVGFRKFEGRPAPSIHERLAEVGLAQPLAGVLRAAVRGMNSALTTYYEGIEFRVRFYKEKLGSRGGADKNPR